MLSAGAGRGMDRLAVLERHIAAASSAATVAPEDIECLDFAYR